MKKWLALVVAVVLAFSFVSQAFAAPKNANAKNSVAKHAVSKPATPKKIQSSCGAATGNAASPIKICNTADLNLLNQYPSSHFILKKSVAADSTWTPVPTFSGVLNGSNKEISGLKRNLFAKNNGKIKNLTLRDVNISNGDSRGALANENNSLISNVKVYGRVYYVTGEVGGIVQTNNGIIERSASYAEVNGKANVGGIVSINNQTGIIRSSSFGGSTGAYANTGGITGINLGKITNCVAWGQVTIVDNSGGGVAGVNHESGVIINTVSAGDVTYTQGDGTKVGPFVGVNTGKIIKPIILNHVYHNGVLVQ